MRLRRRAGEAGLEGTGDPHATSTAFQCRVLEHLRRRACWATVEGKIVLVDRSKNRGTVYVVCGLGEHGAPKLTLTADLP